jgi:hypothetical protein
MTATPQKSVLQVTDLHILFPTGRHGQTVKAVNGISFQPDFVWNKARSTTSSNVLNDAVRGAANYLVSNTTSAEAAAATYLTAFNSNGFSLGTGNFFGNATTVVSWQWKASNAAAVTNTAGSISSQVSANPSAGFSIVARTGTGVAGTIGHGLGVAPKMIINKSRSNSSFNWSVYHANLTNANFVIYLDATNAQGNEPTAWNGTAPTSTVFSVGTSSQTNLNTATYVSYCFSEIAGYSRFGSYTGNGLTDGTFVYTGFRPRFLMVKAITTAVDATWVIKDTSRNPSNVASANLYANLTNAEDTSSVANIDILSNGFKLRGTYNGINGSGQTYIYAAFAENPTKLALAR